MAYLIDAIRPKNGALAYLFDALAILVSSLFIAFSAQIAIPLPFTPVPITLQSFAILLIASLLGSKRGAIAVSVYLFEGILGLPVFSGAASGLALLFGPRGGYLVGFGLSAYVVGFLMERGWKNNYFLTVSGLALGSLIISLLGALQLSFFVGNRAAFTLGVYPFLIGDAIKVLAVAALLPSGWRALKALNLSK